MQLRSIVILLIFFSFDSISQELSARVMVSSGNSFINSDRKIKTGDVLSLEDTINITEGGYLGLRLSNERVFELTGPGIQQLKDYLFDQSKASENPCVAKWRERQNVDSIHRVTDDRVINYQVEIQNIDENKAINVYPSNIRLDLITPKYMDSLVITFYDACDDIIDQNVTDTTFLEIDISTFDLSKIYKNLIQIDITAYNYGTKYYSPRYVFVLTDEERTAKIKKDIIDISANDQRRIYFEQNNLPHNANFERRKN